jgi:hypothetical protein
VDFEFRFAVSPTPALPGPMTDGRATIRGLVGVKGEKVRRGKPG